MNIWTKSWLVSLMHICGTRRKYPQKMSGSLYLQTCRETCVVWQPWRKQPPLHLYDGTRRWQPSGTTSHGARHFCEQKQKYTLMPLNMTEETFHSSLHALVLCDDMANQALILSNWINWKLNTVDWWNFEACRWLCLYLPLVTKFHNCRGKIVSAWICLP